MFHNYPQSLNTLLKSNKLNFKIRNHALKLIKLNNKIINLLPEELKNSCRVANYRQEVLIIEVKNAARKARLNFELPIIILKLRNTILPSLSAINITINPSLICKNSNNYLSNIPNTINLSNKAISKKSANMILKLAKTSPKNLQKKLKSLVSFLSQERL
ncbi:hypothetical protein AUT07_00555 [Candidatus Arsenophonus lipoptenae]|uniref:DUF721 domain-containing protein n=1 Tax=Candidatus Arsenophonus lipoptenae TaxID=634113 RepID=A0A0X9VES7_9GAMM|nr:DciA family protein [Candidatus Arsenophonus lipoptenae]AMA65109.1 hypothetical protein AUT07_00555 [Candidatus Arsenophonus lipoptenae]